MPLLFVAQLVARVTLIQQVQKLLMCELEIEADPVPEPPPPTAAAATTPPPVDPRMRLAFLRSSVRQMRNLPKSIRSFGEDVAEDEDDGAMDAGEHQGRQREKRADADAAADCFPPLPPLPRGVIRPQAVYLLPPDALLDNARPAQSLQPTVQQQPPRLEHQRSGDGSQGSGKSHGSGKRGRESHGGGKRSREQDEEVEGRVLPRSRKSTPRRVVEGTNDEDAAIVDEEGRGAAASVSARQRAAGSSRGGGAAGGGRDTVLDHRSSDADDGSSPCPLGSEDGGEERPGSSSVSAAPYSSSRGAATAATSDHRMSPALDEEREGGPSSAAEEVEPSAAVTESPLRILPDASLPLLSMDGGGGGPIGRPLCLESGGAESGGKSASILEQGSGKRVGDGIMSSFEHGSRSERQPFAADLPPAAAAPMTKMLPPPPPPWMAALPELPPLSQAAAAGASLPQLPLFCPQEPAVISQPPPLVLPAVDLQV